MFFRFYFFIIYALFLGAACSADLVQMHGQTDQDKPKATESPVDSLIRESSADVSDTEITPPTNISGAYLFCQQSTDEVESGTTAQVYCALRDENDHNKIDLRSIASRFTWSYRIPGDLAELVMVDLQSFRSSPEWHTIFTFRASSPEILKRAVAAAFFSVEIVDQNNETYREEMPVGSPGFQWLRLNGGTIPEGALPGGTEHERTIPLFVCRSYHNGGIFPGKLISHFFEPTKSVCYTTFDGQGVESYSIDGTTLIYESDVLLADSNAMEWVPANSSMPLPEKALVTGQTPDGLRIYSCRNLEAGPPLSEFDLPNDPAGEPTPGMLVEGSSNCVHEYYGPRIHSNFEVLVTK